MESFNVARTFGNVPRNRLMKASGDFGVDSFVRRIIHNWLLGCAFKVSLLVYEGKHTSYARQASRELPGGRPVSVIVTDVLQSGGAGCGSAAREGWLVRGVLLLGFSFC